MRNRLIIISGLMVLAVAAFAQPKAPLASVFLGTNTTGTATLTGLNGYIEEVSVVVGGSDTGSVVVAILPYDGVDAISIATNAVTGSKLWRPAVDATDITGAALTTDPPRRYLLAGESVRMTVSGSATNKTWKMRVKLSDK